MKNHPIDAARSSDNPVVDAVADPEAEAVADPVVDPDVVGTDGTSAGDGEVVMAIYRLYYLRGPWSTI